MKIGKILIEYREKFNLTQAKLGKLLNVDQTYISKIESGKREPRNIDFINRIAEHLGLDPSYLEADSGLKPAQLLHYSLDDYLGMTDNALSLARFARESGRANESVPIVRDLISKLESLASRLNSDELMVRLIKAYILLAVILGDLLPEKELTKTVELSNKALSLSREINQKELIARSLLHKGNELRKHGNVAEAIIHLTRAKDLASNDLLRGYAAQALARAYGKTGDRRKFEDALSESLDLVSSSNDGKYNLGTVREVQARANLVIGNIDDAAKYLEEGEQYLDPMLAPWRPIYKITKAHTYLASGEWDRGTILLIESVRLAKLYNLPHQMERLKKIPKSVPVSIRLRTEKLIRDILDQQNYITPIAE